MMEMRKVFDMQDSDKSGTISLEELKASISAACALDDVELESIFSSADVDGDAELTFDEWRDALQDVFFVPVSQL